MGAREERTWEAIRGNHKPSQLGGNVGEGVMLVCFLPTNCRCPHTRKENYLVFWKPVLRRLWSARSWVLSWNSWSSCSLSASLVPIMSAVTALRFPKAHQFAPFRLQTQALLQGTCFRQIWKISARRTANGLTFFFFKDSWGCVPSEHGIFKTGTKEVAKAT